MKSASGLLLVGFLVALVAALFGSGFGRLLARRHFGRCSSVGRGSSVGSIVRNLRARNLHHRHGRILAAVQDAAKQDKDFNDAEMQKVTSAFQMPGMM